MTRGVRMKNGVLTGVDGTSPPTRTGYRPRRYIAAGRVTAKSGESATARSALDKRQRGRGHGVGRREEATGGNRHGHGAAGEEEGIAGVQPVRRGKSKPAAALSRLAAHGARMFEQQAGCVVTPDTRLLTRDY